MKTALLTPRRQTMSVSPRVMLIALAVMFLTVAVVSLGLGRYDIPVRRVIEVLLDPMVSASLPVSPTERNVIFTVRLPRILLAMLAGGGLALAGAILQGVFRNPLVGPQIIGVSSGAAFGGTLAILLSFSRFGLLSSAFSFGLFALVLVYGLQALVGRRNILALVLAGVVISGFFGALVSLVQYLADTDEKLPTIVFWLLGSFATANAEKVSLIAAPVVAASGLLLALRWRLNLLSLGDEDAAALGVRVEYLRWLILCLVTVIVAAQVAVSGVIGWVGLIVPHMARTLVGPDHRSMLPASVLIGATYVIVIDDVARTLSSTEIPLGILTALIGTPVFAILLRRSQVKGSR
jgi:iron complex transport system permease protein